MRAHVLIASGLAALAAAMPMEARQCAGCEPSGKGASGANASNNNTNSNTINLALPDSSGNSGSGSGSGSGGSGNQPPNDTNGEEKGSCKACIDFCTGRADLLDGLCKVIVCGIDCVVV